MAAHARLSREDAATLHLHLWLTALNRTLRVAVERRGASIDELGRVAGPAGTLAPRHAEAIMHAVDEQVRNGVPPLPELALTRREADAERDILRDGPLPPPLERLSRDAGLSAFERAALLIVVAPEVIPEYRRLYGYLVDDMSRSHASIELVLALTAGTRARHGSRRRQLGPGGALRRLGLLNADDALATAMTTRLMPAAGLTQWLLGALPAPPVPLRDARMILPESVPEGPTPATLAPTVRCLATAANAMAGLWGPEPGRHDDAVAQLARALGRPMFQARIGGGDGDWAQRLRHQAVIAAGAGAVLWLETRDLPTRGSDGRALAELLARLPQRILVTGRTPWRAAALIGSRPYADLTLPAPAGGAWPLAADALPPDEAITLDARYRLGFRERCAAVQIALSERRNRGNGTMPELGPALARAARMVATPGHLPSVTLIEPTRELHELILPDALHRQIAEVGALYAHAATVDGAWGFGRLTGSSGALKALFTGDPGTGKTMAAEVIAGTAGVTLMKVDLSQVVSKWVGETEKNLETIFDHAEQSRAALFFDEAEALFGRRGEVRHGTDRYANLEVSYLLQRLESFSGGLVILASNLRDEIDPAFSRRFQIALNFPRPGPAERLRLWRLAFARAPLDAEVDLAAAAALDLTGGAIMTAARMAALLAAGEDAPGIGQSHLDAATERQFRKEARLMDVTQPDGLSVARARG
ncbi:MAG TPA: ATP-binding protein [Rhodospirillales bacterium]|nr:ATP-binding protein [Rhodospirillales bacterium]